jgi:cytoskeletal protein CcmA (bactofilin family)
MEGKSKELSIIDKGLTVEGTVNAGGKLIIAGSLKGTLVGNEVVTVRGSRVVVKAQVQDMVIAGEFEGDVTAFRSLKILRTGVFGGNIVCKDLSLEAGGRLNGSVRPLEADAETIETDVKAPAV